jgi:hypothetical protein
MQEPMPIQILLRAIDDDDAQLYSQAYSNYNFNAIVSYCRIRTVSRPRSRLRDVRGHTSSVLVHGTRTVSPTVEKAGDGQGRRQNHPQSGLVCFALLPRPSSVPRRVPTR